MYCNRGSAHLQAWGRALAAVCGLVLGLATAASAQYTYPTYPTTPGVPTVPSTPGTSVSQLVGIGSVAAISNNGFRVTFSAPYQRGAVWMINKSFVANGFQTSFQFQISGIRGIAENSPFGIQQGGDGFAFVIQNYSIPVVGPSAGFLGYHGLPNSLAVEFDTWWNGEFGWFDPNGNHISVHTRGTAPNSVSETASLGQATNIPFMKDGALHTVSINYVPGTLQVFMDNLNSPILTIPNLNLSSLLSLDNGSAWLGFTGGTGATMENHDIYNWQMGPTGVVVTPQGPFPVTATPFMQPPSSPTQPFVLPPASVLGATGVTSAPSTTPGY
jgi:Bacterial lectin